MGDRREPQAVPTDQRRPDPPPAPPPPRALAVQANTIVEQSIRPIMRLAVTLPVRERQADTGISVYVAASPFAVPAVTTDRLRCVAREIAVRINHDVEGERGIGEKLRRLRAAFDTHLVAEVRRHGGIPALTAEEMTLREAIAELLAVVP